MGRSITGSSFENKKHCIYSLRLNNMQQQHKRGDKQSNAELNVVLKVLPLPPSFERQLRMLSTKSVSN